jgi:RNA polymerase sigma-70 factor (ECF subfamily)
VTEKVAVSDKLGLPVVDEVRDLSEEQQIGLAGRILAGDTAAESEFVRLFSPRIFAMLCARTRDRESSRDLLHDVLINVLRALRNGQLRDPGKLAAFVHGITRHAAQSHQRNRNSREQPIEVEPAARVAGDAVENSERRDLIRLALQELDSTDRDILIRTLVDDQKPGIIARALGLSSDVVRQRKTRATRKVAEFVKSAQRAGEFLRKSVTKSGPGTTLQ